MDCKLPAQTIRQKSICNGESHDLISQRCLGGPGSPAQATSSQRRALLQLPAQEAGPANPALFARLLLPTGFCFCFFLPGGGSYLNAEFQMHQKINILRLCGLVTRVGGG